MLSNTLDFKNYDPLLWNAIKKEESRQEQHIELIASENHTSPMVMLAQGSVLTNKYAEGYPGRRYYGGCENVDVAEQLAIDRAKLLFNCDYANVQPHSGSQANAAVYLALLEPGDTILGLSLDHGGHLTHGATPNFSGKIYNAIHYGLNPETGEIDYDQVEALAREHNLRSSWLASQPTLRSVTGQDSAESQIARGLFFLSIWPTSRVLSLQRIPESCSACPCGNHHHPQDASRASRRTDFSSRPTGASKKDQLANFSRSSGWTSHARHRSQGVGLQGGTRTDLQGIPKSGHKKRQGNGE